MAYHPMALAGERRDRPRGHRPDRSGHFSEGDARLFHPLPGATSAAVDPFPGEWRDIGDYRRAQNTVV